MGGKDDVLPKPLLKKHIFNCLTSEENTIQPYYDNIRLFHALFLLLHGNQRLEEKASKIFSFFSNKVDEFSPNKFLGVHMEVIPDVEDLLRFDILLFDKGIVEVKINGEFARRSVQKHGNTVRLLRHKNHICYVSDINAVFQSLWCPFCDTFFNKTSIL